MTTITQEAAERVAVKAGLTADRAYALFEGTGITITPPATPEAMVKLAREIAVSVGGGSYWSLSDIKWLSNGDGDDHAAVQAALTAAAATLNLHGAQMAAALGVSRRTWCRWLSGQTPVPVLVAREVERMLREKGK